jgi:DNA-binding MarR family transcriptional regulator
MRTTSEGKARESAVERAAREIVTGATTFASRARSERAAMLTLTETGVLGQLFKHDAMTPGEVARRLRQRKQSLTRTFAKLEERGLLRRLEDPADGRQSILVITDAGRKALGAEMEPRRRWAARAIEQELTAAERELLAKAAPLLSRLAEVDTDLVREDR